MRTLILQSYRREAVPDWLQACLDSVAAWAGAQNHEYRFLDDALFDFVPAALRAEIGPDRVVQSDYARLAWARQSLASGVDRVVWIDADVLILAPADFRLPEAVDFAFCREVWLSPDGRGGLQAGACINNAISLYGQGNPMLDFYLHACEQRIGAADTPLPKLELGTAFLTPLHQLCRLPLIPHVGMLSPRLGEALRRDHGAVIDHYLAQAPEAHYAMNLCASLRGLEMDGLSLDDAYFRELSACLLEGGGAVLNRRLPRV